MAYNSYGGIDLHIHSTASDGSLLPTEIVDIAHRLHLGAFAITDHDTIEGAREILTISLPLGLNFIPGIEMSAAPPQSFGLSGSLHLLGYGIDVENPELNELLVLLHQSRDNRTPQIINSLSQLGIQLTMADIQAQVGSGIIGRPHIASALVAKGYAESIDDAFDRYLSKGKPAYVDKFRVSCQKAMETIRTAGGLTVLAHPYLVSQDSSIIEKLVETLIPLGLAGIECYYPEHPTEATSFYRDIAQRKGLLITGGTDFHGPEIRPGIQIGSADGNFNVPFELYKKLVDRLQENKPS